jgi:hypothetical protein
LRRASARCRLLAAGWASLDGIPEKPLSRTAVYELMLNS